MNKSIYKLNPTKAYQMGKEQGHTKGVHDGFVAFSALAIIAAYNIADDEMPDDKFAEWANKWEAETMRIFKEEYEYKPDEILCKVVEMRKRFNLEEL